MRLGRLTMTIIRRLLGLHVHAYGLWTVEERVEKLYSIAYGKTESPAFFNVRFCACGHRQMQRIKV